MDIKTIALYGPGTIFIAAIAVIVHMIFKIFGRRNITPFAGFWARSSAKLFDLWLLQYVMYTATPLVLYSMGSKLNTPNDFELIREASAFWINIATLPTFILYCTIFECSKMQGTPGKYYFNIKIVDKHGRRIGIMKALQRNLLKFVSVATFGLGYIMVGWTRHKQSLHDKMSGCFVVRRVRQRNNYAGPWARC